MSETDSPTTYSVGLNRASSFCCNGEIVTDLLSSVVQDTSR